MKLTTWLKRNKKDYKYVAKRLDIDPSMAHRKVNQKRKFTLHEAVKIELFTNREVKAKDLDQ